MLFSSAWFDCFKLRNRSKLKRFAWKFNDSRTPSILNKLPFSSFTYALKRWESISQPFFWWVEYACLLHNQIWSLHLFGRRSLTYLEGMTHRKIHFDLRAMAKCLQFTPLLVDLLIVVYINSIKFTRRA